METTTATSAAASTTAQSSANTQAAPKASGLASDFETFLKMLTAQARYQDPLEPVDSTEYAAQLAQFSMVEQQVQTNDTLSALFEQMGVSSMASLAGWVGMEVRAETPMYFDGTPIEISTNPAKTADQAFLVVLDGTGEEIQRLAIETVPETIEWAGTTADGVPIENGVYEFKVESFSNGEEIRSGTTEVYGRISEAQIKDSVVMLVLPGGQEIPASAVSALRSAG